MSTIEERVKKIIIEQLGVKEEDVKSAASFVDDLGADSLDTVELVMALEEEFDTEIPDEDAEKITTVQAAIDYILSHQDLSPDSRSVVLTLLFLVLTSVFSSRRLSCVKAQSSGDRPGDVVSRR